MLTLIAQITNPAVESMPAFTGNSGATGALILGKYIAIAITTAVTLGALAVLVYFVLGAINWITAGGDKGKVEKAQQRIIQAFIGLALLVFSVAILGFVGPRFFNLNLLRPEFINLLGGTSGTPGVPGHYEPIEE
jgi:NADH:ubiquinone oxidoreductase subunit 6 (subunit J)